MSQLLLIFPPIDWESGKKNIHVDTFICPLVLEMWSHFELEVELCEVTLRTWSVREDGQSPGSNGAAFVPGARSLDSSEVEGTEGVLEAAGVVLSVDGPTFAEAGGKYLKSTMWHPQ